MEREGERAIKRERARGREMERERERERGGGGIKRRLHQREKKMQVRLQ